ncbi:MAG TPA: phosphoethanolamine transferase domain-containing protein, partial [Cellvibrio sp.]|nr:phosphoethanolamine transferase domain-containing protein [Cellvibrio sp.]
MRFITMLSQRQVSLALSVYIGIILNSACLIRNGSAGSWIEAISALLSAVALFAFCYLLISFFSLFGKVTYKALASITLLSSAAASYYMTFFNVVIGYGVIVSTLTLDTDLNSEALGYEFLLWFLITGILPCIWLWRAQFTQSLYANAWRNSKSVFRRTVPLVCVGIALSLSIKTIVKLQENQARKNNQYTASIGGIIAHSYLPSNWIASLAIYAHQLSKEETSSKELFDPSKQFTYQPSQSMDDLFVVFVIGETTRWDHMGLFGYERDT